MAKLKGTRFLQLHFLFLILSITSHMLVVCQDVCRPHDVQKDPDCTAGFASSFHIEVVKEQADLHEHDGRQVLIPAMNFNCSGTLSKWIFPAIWKGNSQAFTELQIWRRTGSSGSVFLKAGAVTIQVAGESVTQLYEMVVDPPLVFQAGDIVGYYQPFAEISQLNIYLEDSEKIDTFRDNVGNDQVLPPNGTFDLNSPHLLGQDYPLIGAETDPPNCGCGLVTTERMKALLKLNREDFGTRNVFPQEQLLYPNSQFTCSGHVVKWIFGAMFMSTREINPELQIWRPISNTTFQKLYGSIITSSVEVTSGIYEFAVNPPLPVKPGDILGVFQPPLVRSKLLVEFDTAAENPMNFYLPLGATALEPSHTFVDIAVGNWQRGTILPLVTAQISLDAPPTTTTSNLVTNPAQTTANIQQTPTRTTTNIQLTPSHNTTTIQVTPTQPTTTGQLTPTPTTIGTLTPVTTQRVTSQTAPFTRSITPTMPTVSEVPVSLSIKPFVGTTDDLPESAAVQTFTNTVQIIPVQASISVSIEPAGTSATENLTFYVGLGVVAMLVVLIAVLIIVLLLVLLYPRKGKQIQKTVQLSPDPSNGPEYEAYTDATDAPASLDPPSPNSTEQNNAFDDPIYNAPNQQHSNCNLLDIRELYPKSPNDTSPNHITAYAVSNVHCTTNKALVTAPEPNNDYDYAEP